jgi:multicomponent Na+:H+ antiporter subunit D
MHVSPPARAFPIAAVLAPAGAFAFVEVAVHAFGPEVLAELSAARWLGWAAALTILWGAVRALRAREVKDAVAGAVLAQLGVFALGALCDPGAAVAELGPRIALPAAGALALYLCAANLELAARRTGLDELAGLGRAMPLAFAGFALGALALLLPGSIAAWGPWRETALRPAWLGALALGTLAGLAALLAVPWRAFRRSPPRVVPEGDPLLVRGAPPVLALAPALALLAGGALCWLSSRVPAP